MHLICSNSVLRPWEASDKAALLKHGNNYKIWKNLRDRFPHPYTPEAADWWLKHASNQNPNINFAIEVDGEAVGGIGLEPQQDIARISAEIGFWLGESYWGKGIITEAIKTITYWAITTLDLKRIYALTFSQNLGSIRALEKAGYLQEGLIKRGAIKEGVVKDLALLAFTDLELVAQTRKKPL